MKWNREAEDALKQVPFFVRKRVKTRVEEEARRREDDLVTLHHVKTCRKRFLDGTADEIKGYRVETCFGPGGCPNRAVDSDGLAGKVGQVLAGRNLKSFLREKVNGPLRFHHEFHVSFSDCPNACSCPQIADIGLIGASKPKRVEEPCSRCAACVEACRESAVSLDETGPVIGDDLCLACGACVRVCPTGTLEEESIGYRVLVGGKLGRHPRLGEELPGIHAPQEIPAMIEGLVDRYQAHCRNGERLAVVLERTGTKKFFMEPEKSKSLDLCQ